ncbi:MAG: hypothetical protein CMQ20_08210 [Gammaproteobacteria bacterium]|jgi:hypothetical protein|nr:hypothetical protein [Gammaproteobacteria bacterium]|tara:strand:- start:88 stop:279 length:192 start_codon:yes stop_codon:yes gene_type:complete
MSLPFQFQHKYFAQPDKAATALTSVVDAQPTGENKACFLKFCNELCKTTGGTIPQSQLESGQL